MQKIKNIKKEKDQNKLFRETKMKNKDKWKKMNENEYQTSNRQMK